MAELENLGVAFVVPGQLDMTSPTGRLLAHFLGAIAEFERQLIRERVCSGLANARAKSKRLGRPRATPILVSRGLSMIDKGMTYAQASNKSGVGVSTLVRARRDMARDSKHPS